MITNVTPGMTAWLSRSKYRLSDAAPMRVVVKRKHGRTDALTHQHGIVPLSELFTLKSEAVEAVIQHRREDIRDLEHRLACARSRLKDAKTLDGKVFGCDVPGPHPVDAAFATALRGVVADTEELGAVQFDVVFFNADGIFLRMAAKLDELRIAENHAFDRSALAALTSPVATVIRDTLTRSIASPEWRRVLVVSDDT